VKEHPLQIKKLYTLAAFEVQKAREKNETELTRAHGLTTLGGGFAAGNTVTHMTRAQATVQGLVTRDAAAAQVFILASPSCRNMHKRNACKQAMQAMTCYHHVTELIALQGQESMDRAWHGAEAYHFWMLAHRQLYRGDYKAGLRTALNLKRYDEVIPEKSIYCLLALMAYCAGYYGQCSKALTKLETLEGTSEVEREHFSNLAVTIFTRHAPQVRQLSLPYLYTAFTWYPRRRFTTLASVQDPADISEARVTSLLSDAASLLNGISSEKDLICVATGRVIKSASDEALADNTTRCHRCWHHSIVAQPPHGQTTRREVASMQCPLCHARCSDRDSTAGG
jgi:WD repeat-containing protein 35